MSVSTDDGISSQQDRIRSLVAENNALRASAADLARRKVAGDLSAGGSLWEALSASPAATAFKRRIIRIDRGVKGYVVYGPYVSLLTGAYRVSLVVNVLADEAGSGDPFAVFDVVYGQILFARKVLTKGDTTLHTADFVVSAAMAKALTGPEFEFRLESRGTCAFEVVDLSLQRLDSQTRPAGVVIELSDLVTPGAASSKARLPKIVAERESEGNVFFGPYLRLPAGTYRADVALSSRSSAPAAGELLVDVVSDRPAPLAVKKFRVQNGSSTVSVEFSIADPDTLADLPSRIEFRLAKPRGIEVEVLGVTCTATA